eukprot:CAMPEP_0119489224 /NCGR_PEP_ID=MMETSP1344-20130328/14747_1 /TAXON_ID=236787 /ORGANISM="Florenciella parvula, Strain CCMP2471" /LENGTH=103 /DNA_ID=CAMNT_0007524245 /DNA_START=171 /DNA_END=482 /DNA_ORIENTATION=-
MTKDELAKFNGKDGNRLGYSCNGKVIEITGNAPESLKTMSTRFAGKEITYYMACMLYDPLYGMPESAKDMSEEHKKSIEHNLAINLKAMEADPPVAKVVAMVV